MLKLVPSLAILLAIATALPASAETFYVAVNNKTGRCQVTTKMPDGATVTQVSSDTYATRRDAATAMKAACTK